MHYKYLLSNYELTRSYSDCIVAIYQSFIDLVVICLVTAESFPACT